MENVSVNPSGNPLLDMSEALAAVVERIGPSTLAVCGRGRRGIASAVVWRSGIVVTAAHVLRHARAAVTLVPADGQTIDATLVGTDSATDIAVLRLPDEALAAAPIGDAAAVRCGHLVMAIGRSVDAELTASHGLVNRTGGPWQTWLGGHVDRLIRLDGGLYDGLSGAPVADAHGHVIGMASSALSRSYGIVVPAATVSRVVDAMLARGHVARGFVGIGAQPVALPKPADGGSASGTGLLITALVPDGPADRAGLLVGDIVVHIAGQPAGTLSDLRSALAGHVGASVEVSILRGGAPTTKSLVVGEWPARRHGC